MNYTCESLHFIYLSSPSSQNSRMVSRRFLTVAVKCQPPAVSYPDITLYIPVLYWCYIRCVLPSAVWSPGCSLVWSDGPVKERCGWDGGFREGDVYVLPWYIRGDPHSSLLHVRRRQGRATLTQRDARPVLSCMVQRRRRGRRGRGLLSLYIFSLLSYLYPLYMI